MGIRFERSHSTDRALGAEVRPTLRGIAHRAAAIMSWPAAVAATIAAPAGVGRMAVAVFATGIAAMFTLSAIVHYRPWGPDTTEVLFRLDHTGIYLAITGTAVAVGLLGLHGWARVVIVAILPGLALVGIVLEWLPSRTPRGVAHALYLVLGWATIPFVPMVAANRGWTPAGLLLVGGVLYTVGSVVVARRRPDPWPRIFGYHEIWHLAVIGAVVAHWLMLGELIPAA